MNKKISASEVILLVAIACGVIYFLVLRDAKAPEPASNQETQTQTETKRTAKNPTKAIDTPAPEIEYSKISYGVLYEDHGIRITSTEYKETATAITLKCLAENNSGVDVKIYDTGVAVNGFMVAGELDSSHGSVTIANGKKANLTFEISKSKYSSYGIDKTKKIELQFGFEDEEDKIFDVDNCRPEPSVILTDLDDGKYTRVVQKVIYDKNGITVGFVSESNNRYRFLVTNRTGGFFRLFGLEEPFSINEFSITWNTASTWTDFFYDTIFDGDALLIEMDLTEHLATNGISAVTSIEFKLECSKPGYYYGQNLTDTIIYQK